MMNNKIYLLLSGLIMGFTAASAYSNEGANDLCSKLPGHWQGIYTIKNLDHCEAYNGCTHLIMADATYLSGNTFRLKLYPAVGQGGEFKIQCENGVITSPVNPGNSIKASCDSMNHCFVIYSDPLLTSEMAKL